MKKRALTLIEVVVVVVIIIVLAALLFPIFSKAKQKGTETAAIANLKSYAQALELYRADWGMGSAGAGSLAASQGFPHSLEATAELKNYGYVYERCNPGCVETDSSNARRSKCAWINFLPPVDPQFLTYGEAYAIRGGMCFTDPSIPFGNYSFPHTGIGIRADHSLIRYTKPGAFGTQPWWHDNNPEGPMGDR